MKIILKYKRRRIFIKGEDPKCSIKWNFQTKIALWYQQHQKRVSFYHCVKRKEKSKKKIEKNKKKNEIVMEMKFETKERGKTNKN